MKWRAAQYRRDHFRKQTGRPRPVSERVLEWDESFIAGQMPENSNSSHKKMLLRALRRSIHYELTDRQRLMLMMYMDGKTMPRISAELGVNVSTVSRTIARAKRRIKHTLQFYVDTMRNAGMEDDDD